MIITARIIIFLGTMLLFVPNISAQIQGGVRDAANKSVSFVTITATDSTGKIVATIKSDKRGFYSFKGLTPGKYKIEATASGFKNAVYKNVPVMPKPHVDIEITDISSDTRLEIILTPVKVPK